MKPDEKSWTAELYEWMMRMNIPTPCIMWCDEQGNYWVKPMNTRCTVMEAANG